jgi:hypothetical protein
MKKKLTVTAFILCLLLQSGCYVSTNFAVQSRHLPADFSAPVLVVSLRDKIGLSAEHLAALEQDALKALTDEGINCVSLNEAIGDNEAEDEIQQLTSNDYRALLTIVIAFWGSKTEILPDPVPPSVDSIETDRDSTFYPPGSIERYEKPGPTSSYKEVAMVGSLMDLQTKRLVWSGQVNARPGVVGRSFVYHSFNRSLEHEYLARRCFQKLAGELASVWPKNKVGT